MTHGLVDIHQHVIYGVDDGPTKWEETEAMLEKAVSQGIERIVATSHVSPGRTHFDYNDYLDKLNKINYLIWEKKWKLKLLPGCEIYYSPQVLDRLTRRKIPTLAMSDHVLVEFSPFEEYRVIYDALRTLSNAGYRPILAHVDRYQSMFDKMQLVLDLKGFDTLIQMNAQTVLRSQSFGAKRFVRRLLEEGVVDFVATDAHNTSSRPVCLGDAHQFLAKNYSQELADQLTWKNQSLITPALNTAL